MPWLDANRSVKCAGLTPARSAMGPRRSPPPGPAPQASARWRRRRRMPQVFEPAASALTSRSRLPRLHRSHNPPTSVIKPFRQSPAASSSAACENASRPLRRTINAHSHEQRHGPLCSATRASARSSSARMRAARSSMVTRRASLASPGGRVGLLAGIRTRRNHTGAIFRRVYRRGRLLADRIGGRAAAARVQRLAGLIGRDVARRHERAGRYPEHGRPQGATVRLPRLDPAFRAMRDICRRHVSVWLPPRRAAPLALTQPPKGTY